MVEKSVKFDEDGAKYDASEIVLFLEEMKGLTTKKNLQRLVKPLSAVVVFPDIMDHFAKELGPDGKWSSWSANYALKLRKQGKGGNRILQDTGFLRQSFFPGSKTAGARVGNGQILWFNSATTKSGFPYAAHHDAGKSDGQRPRKFMWISDGALDKAAGLLLEFAVNPKRFK